MVSVKGTASVSDSRARQKELRKTRFPRNFKKTVNLGKVHKPVLTQWIEQKITAILGFEDEIVSSTAINLFLPSDNTTPDPKKAQLDLAGFLGDEAVTFSKELWTLMLEAQENSAGIPQTLLEEKKKEMAAKLESNGTTHQYSHDQGRPHRSSERSNSRFDQNNTSRPNNNPPHQDDVTSTNGRSSESAPLIDIEASKGKEGRKPPPAVGGASDQTTDQFGRALPNERPRNPQRQGSRNQDDRNRPSPPQAPRRRRDRSRSRERYERRPERYHPINEDRRRFDDRGHHSNYNDDRTGFGGHYRRHHDRFYDRDHYNDDRNRRHRHYDYHHERDSLERRLDYLKQEHMERNKNRDNRGMHRIEDEIDHIRRRIHDLEQHRRRHLSSRDDDRRRWSHRDRSPSHEPRRGGRRHRSRSIDSESSGSMHSTRSDDHSSDGSVSDESSRRSYSASPERTRRNKSRSDRDRDRRRRSRSRSSERSVDSP